MYYIIATCSKVILNVHTWKVIAAIFMSIEITPALVPEGKKKDNVYQRAGCSINFEHTLCASALSIGYLQPATYEYHYSDCTIVHVTPNLSVHSTPSCVSIQ